MKNIIDLSGKKILVTGASDGVGAVIAKELSEVGATVILVARREEKLQETMKTLSGEGHSYYTFDLSQIDGIEGLIKQIVSENGKLDGIVHSAGRSAARPLKQINFECIHNVMLINFYAFFELTRVFSNKKYNTGKGSIVVMSSTAARRGDKAQSAYGASKAAIEGAIKILAKELAEKNIRINAITAGMIRTGMFDAFSDRYDESSLTALLNKQYLGIIEREDIACAAAYLLSDAARFITGTGMVVDGGYLS